MCITLSSAGCSLHNYWKKWNHRCHSNAWDHNPFTVQHWWQFKGDSLEYYWSFKRKRSGWPWLYYSLVVLGPQGLFLALHLGIRITPGRFQTVGIPGSIPDWLHARPASGLPAVLCSSSRRNLFYSGVGRTPREAQVQIQRMDSLSCCLFSGWPGDHWYFHWAVWKFCCRIGTSYGHGTFELCMKISFLFSK